MRKFHKYSLSSSSKNSNQLSCSHPASKVNSTNVTDITKLQEKCDICEAHMHPTLLIRSRFQHKYNQSERFFYIKDVDDLIASNKLYYSDNRTVKAIHIKDLLQYHQIEEMLKAYQPASGYQQRFSRICEYFKYYKDLSRYTMEVEGEIIRRHYERHRILDYNRLRHVLNLQCDLLEHSESGDDDPMRNSQNKQKKEPLNGKYSNILKDMPCSVTKLTSVVLSLDNKENQADADEVQTERSLISLRAQLSQLIAAINQPSDNRRQSQPFRVQPIAFRKRHSSSLPDCSTISAIYQRESTYLRQLPLAENLTKSIKFKGHSRNLTNPTSLQNKSKPTTGGRNTKMLRTIESPLREGVSRILKKGRKYRSECSVDQQKLMNYKNNVEIMSKSRKTTGIFSKLRTENNANKKLKATNSRNTSLKSNANINKQLTNSYSKGQVIHKLIFNSKPENKGFTMSRPLSRDMDRMCGKAPPTSNILVTTLMKSSKTSTNPFKKKSHNLKVLF